MKKILKWTGIVLVALLVIVAIAGAYFANNFENRLAKTYEVTPARVPVPTDSALLSEGERLAKIHCIACHGKDLGGTEFFNDAAIGSVPASNLTAGQGGKGREYDEVDFIRAIRHGIKKDGTPAFIMPAAEFQHLSDEDLGAIVGYLKSVPQQNRNWSGPQITFLGRALAGAGLFGDVINAENIDHAAIAAVSAPVRGATAEYGRYLVKTSGCPGCHGKELNGMQPGEPGAPFAPNLTPGGNVGKWSEDQFRAALRTGVTPDQRQLNPSFMPWPGFAYLHDDEISALYKYLQAQPALASAK
ncbi:c-type cytochrome [Salmonirosea aquatica]|uniref:C-type cytochrome n=1 Tax=Salmonirosea aquatica TaxID=2654236 RepID=A0A7C9FT41_9BACT|nr:c-type cytochrome [Cytophagaceae bacterium SJW1-29]